MCDWEKERRLTGHQQVASEYPADIAAIFNLHLHPLPAVAASAIAVTTSVSQGQPKDICSSFTPAGTPNTGAYNTCQWQGIEAVLESYQLYNEGNELMCKNMLHTKQANLLLELKTNSNRALFGDFFIQR